MQNLQCHLEFGILIFPFVVGITSPETGNKKTVFLYYAVSDIGRSVGPPQHAKWNAPFAIGGILSSEMGYLLQVMIPEYKEETFI